MPQSKQNIWFKYTELIFNKRVRLQITDTAWARSWLYSYIRHSYQERLTHQSLTHSVTHSLIHSFTPLVRVVTIFIMIWPKTKQFSFAQKIVKNKNTFINLTLYSVKWRGRS